MDLVWHFDFHTPGHVRVGDRCDFDGVAGSLVDAGVGAAIIFAKCHFGFSYYPTKVGTPHPRLAADVFGGLLKAMRAKGLKVQSYVSFGIDGAGAEAHPEWRRTYSDGTSDPSGWFINVCPFTSYLDQRVLPQIEELARIYQPDGYWFDTMSALSPCYCRQCRDDFQRETGAPLPIAMDDPLQARAGQWRHDRGFALVSRVAEYIRSLDPAAAVGFNQLGSLPYPEPMPVGVTVLTLDPETQGPQSIPFSLNAAYGSNAPLPCEIMPTIFHGGWGDWSPAPLRRLESTALACWIRGATFIPGDRLHPEGHLTEISQNALTSVAALRSCWEDCAPGSDAMLAPDVLILHSPSLTNGDDLQLFAVDDPRARLTPINGMHRLLLDAGFNFTVAAEWELNSALRDVSVVVVPEIPTLSIKTEKWLMAFAADGGKILFIGTLPTVDGHPFSGTGVEVCKGLWQDHAYLPALRDGEPEVLVRGGMNAITTKGAEARLALIEAYDSVAGSRYGWGIGPSSHISSLNPALTRCALGRGEIWFLNAPIASDYARMGNWPQMAWISDLLENVAPEVRGVLLESGGNLELVLWQDSSSTWIFLLDHETEQLVGEGRFWSRTTRCSATRDFALSIATQGRSPKLHTLRGEKIVAAANPTHLNITGAFKRPFCALRIDWPSANTFPIL